MIKVIKPQGNTDLYGIIEINGIEYYAQYLNGNYYIDIQQVEEKTKDKTQ